MKPTKDSIAFTKANRQRRKVLIAKDVIKWINSSKIIPTNHSGYLDVMVYEGKKPGSDLRKIFKSSSAQCEVCAIGAVFCASVLRNDKFLTGYSYIEKHEMVHYLKNVFTDQELCDIERAYEAFAGYDKYYDKLIPDQRVIVLMKNIIRNKGNFVYGDPKDFE